MKLENYIIVLENVLSYDVLTGLVTEQPISDTVKKVGEQYMSMSSYGIRGGYNYIDYSVIRQVNPVIERKTDVLALFNTSGKPITIYLNFNNSTFDLPPDAVMLLPNNKLFDFMFRKQSETDVIMAYYDIMKVADEDSITD